VSSPQRIKRIGYVIKSVTQKRRDCNPDSTRLVSHKTQWPCRACGMPGLILRASLFLFS
jgi:hypothetical protein